MITTNGKARIVLDIEPELKELFQERIYNCNRRWKMTAILRLAMYEMIYMDNNQLENFIGNSQMGTLHVSSYIRLASKAKKEGIWPEMLPLGNSQIEFIRQALYDRETGKIGEDEIKQKLSEAVLKDEQASPWKSLQKSLREAAMLEDSSIVGERKKGGAKGKKK